MCNLNIRGDEGDKDWETKVPEDVAQALKVNLLRNHREIYIDYTVLRFENGVQFNPNSGGNSEFGGAVTILIFLRTDGIKEALWWSGNLYQEVVTWVGDFYISYGVMKRG